MNKIDVTKSEPAPYAGTSGGIVRGGDYMNLMMKVSFSCILQSWEALA